MLGLTIYVTGTNQLIYVASHGSGKLGRRLGPSEGPRRAGRGQEQARVANRLGRILFALGAYGRTVLQPFTGPVSVVKDSGCSIH